jgi:hypothetical protein
MPLHCLSFLGLQLLITPLVSSRRVWKYQRGNQYWRTDNTMDKRKSTKGKQPSSKHTHKAKDRVTQFASCNLGNLTNVSSIVNSILTNNVSYILILTLSVTWWRLFQKRVVHTKFDIYAIIAKTREMQCSLQFNQQY